MNIIYKVKRNVRVMMMLWIFIFIFHISIISPVLNAEDEKSDKLQYLHFKQILFEENLSQSGVTCILQDKKGFMWFGTQEGLNRFDGYEMKVFKHDPNDKKSLSDNYILCMYEDKGGNLWIGTNGGGLNKFNPQTGVFDIYTNEEKGKEKEKNSLSDNAVQTIVQDDTDMIWVGTRSGGVDKFSPQTNHFENYNQQLNIQNGDKEKNIHVIYKD
ncbi:MAG TPA: two-component regulator propeller domain-containing protein, partial [Candidatus Kapabacteria bacterium]|nr:two-component regulator propeller domain-containing protein [Candidatus Kapabacteria bacterium]